MLDLYCRRNRLPFSPVPARLKRRRERARGRSSALQESVHCCSPANRCAPKQAQLKRAGWLLRGRRPISTHPACRHFAGAPVFDSQSRAPSCWLPPSLRAHRRGLAGSWVALRGGGPAVDPRRAAPSRANQRTRRLLSVLAACGQRLSTRRARSKASLIKNFAKPENTTLKTSQFKRICPTQACTKPKALLYNKSNEQKPTLTLEP